MINKKERFRIFFFVLIGVIYPAFNLGYSQSSPDNIQVNKKQEIVFFIVDYPDSVSNSTQNTSPYTRALTYLFNALEKDPIISKNYQFRKKETPGSFDTAISIDNLQKKDSVYGIGIAQSDVLYHYLKGNHPQVPASKKNSDIRAVAKLFKEWLHISVHESEIGSINDKLKAGVQILPQYPEIQTNDIGSGSFVTTINIGRILNLKWTTINTKSSTSQHLNFTVKSPENTDDTEIQIGLDQSSSRLISSSFPKVYEVVSTNEFHSIYPNQIIKENDRTTISVDAILICSRLIPNDIILEIRNILCSAESGKIFDGGRAEDAKLFGIDKNRFQNLPINRHSLLVEEEIDPFSSAVVWLISKRLIVILTILAMIYLLIRSKIPLFWKAIRSDNLKPKTKLRFILNNSGRLGTIVLLYVLYHFLISVFIYVSEFHYAKESVADDQVVAGGIQQLFLSSWSHLSVGDFGEILNSDLAMLWVGILQFSYALATSVAAYMAGDKIIRFIKNKRMKNHVVIIGWSSIGEKIVKELGKMNELYKKEIIDISIIGSLDYGDTDVPKDLKNHYFKKHELIEDLRKTNIIKAKALIVLSDPSWSKDQNNTDLDLFVINRIDELNTYLTQSKSERHPRIIAEIQNERNIELAEKNGADEVICVQYFGFELLAQAATRPNISKIFQNLLKSTKDSNEIYYREIPTCEGIKNNMKYSKFIRHLIEQNKMLNQTPIGLVTHENGKMVHKINPDDNYKVKSTDQIIVLAREQNW